MQTLPARYNFREVELKWQEFWEKSGIYRFDKGDREKPTFSIDTPPPYPSGELHVGNALNFAYIDFAARYKRMNGYNVFFPIGWDCHGLPTEVRVERTLGKRRREIPTEEFLRLCREYTLKWIEPMRAALKAMGCSIDWSAEYMTMNPDYWRRTQLSFILLYRKGLICREVHPVVWCPRCETAIAEAEVEHMSSKRELHFYKFRLKDGSEVVVASTRPELLAACVALAVNPNDRRYSHLVGKTAVVP
ncbi:MAG: class I tRNA ligase family protein, partial [Thermofilaceae archaeon]